MQRIGSTVITLLAAGWLSAFAQVPQPFPGRQPPPPRPAPAKPTPPAPTPTAPPPPTAPEPARTVSNVCTPAGTVPTEATLGFPIYPNAQFIASYDATRGQCYHLFGSEVPFAALVKYYQSALKTRGTVVFDAPPVHIFEVGRFREETMAFPPGVTIKDYTWNGSTGYINPKKGATPARFASIIQIVPSPPGTAR